AMAELSSESSEELLSTSELTEDPPATSEPRGRRRRRRRRPTYDSFAAYFPKVLRKVHADLSLSQRAVSVLDSLVKDVFERIGEEAKLLVRSNNRATLTSRDIQTAVRLLLPHQLGRHALSQGTRAVLRYQLYAHPTKRR
uniref:Core Histone H2A/H2B/H3 domain-containing protein n=1 Tax=Myotis lucifugus TaxID=59463 RepID=G1PGU9_MYOLU